MQVRGRYLVIAWTVVFLATVGTIVLRARSGILARRRVDAIADTIRAYSSSKADLESKVAELTSARVLIPKATALGLRGTSDSAVVLLHLHDDH